MTLRYGLIGLGSMGRHHARNIRALEGAELVAVADPYGDKFGVAGDLEVLPDVDALIDAGIDAAMVAVPTGQHAEVALKLAAAGVHTMVEKPLASTIEEGKALVDAFESAGLVGAVGYVERCNPALLEMRRRIAEGQLGKIYQITTRRQSPFPARIADVGVVKDLATHDVDLTAWVAGAQYATISAQTAHRAGRQYEDLVTASGKLTNGVLVNHLVNWLTPYKERQTVVLGEHGALVADTTMGDLTFFENGSLPLGWDQISAFRGVSEGQVIRYAFEKREPLAVEHEHFRDAILGTSSEHVTMREALTTMEVVHAMLDSAANDGQTIAF
ncbi:Gfo/Idh/MocA family protein [Trueperella pecoris]|uniref:Gfo/Idh/MocA family oxidoreductase n=1 Tax=Trueperella pecoris TaxID=2733571 RepID=A0A7M1QT85_9ACTO|nr:Gfo/Idh/MocA family oxidoreductase [Trueperella pecoris]QOQ38305.1 Gfo/Idh/MocA family oxidoreductase [Trueperella pecoris]QOR45209.1 Gfo/Idh/MocA family oxidoreductase [Trueperella pecoris]QTG75113.1 Gfo/Idh/MocA family oxidoreductase [Trueperella pecoris]